MNTEPSKMHTLIFWPFVIDRLRSRMLWLVGVALHTSLHKLRTSATCVLGWTGGYGGRRHCSFRLHRSPVLRRDISLAIEAAGQAMSQRGSAGRHLEAPAAYSLVVRRVFEQQHRLFGSGTVGYWWCGCLILVMHVEF